MINHINYKKNLLNQNIIYLQNSFKIDLINTKLDLFTENNENQEISYKNIYQKKINNLMITNQAEIDNIRKRTLEDIQKIKKLALEKFILELLPVIDNLERAIEASVNITDNIIISLIQGVKLTLHTLNNVLNKFGVKVVDQKNVIFNPLIHQAVSIIETDNLLPDYVIMIMQKGYILNGKLIRPAMVSVSKKKYTIN